MDLARAAALALLLPALAGCAGGPAPSKEFVAAGSAPVAFDGLDLNGTTAQPGTGDAAIRTDAAADAGSVEANFTWQNQTWHVAFQRFDAATPWQEGGVRANFPARGASGNGDAGLPGFQALSAGFGPGNATVNGAPFVDPATGSGALRLSYWVADAAVRDPASHRVTKADGATLYDPGQPGDAKTYPNQRRILLDVQGAGAPIPNASATFNDTVQGPNYNRSFALPVLAPGARIAINVTVQPAGPAPLAPGLLTFVLADPDGRPQARYEYGPSSGPAGGQGHLDAAPPLAAGNWTLQVFGSLANVAYTAASQTTYPAPLFLHVEYESVRLG